jgi:hypothetical protein
MTTDVTPAWQAADVALLMRRTSFVATAEAALQAGIAAALEAAGMPAQREVRLTAHGRAGRDRIDFLVNGHIGVEVKVAGSAADVLRQLQRYAEDDQLSGLVLVTTRAAHATLPMMVGGKVLHTVIVRGTG